jgi:hypothetical protein
MHAEYRLSKVQPSTLALQLRGYNCTYPLVPSPTRCSVLSKRLLRRDVVALVIRIRALIVIFIQGQGSKTTNKDGKRLSAKRNGKGYSYMSVIMA